MCNALLNTRPVLQAIKMGLAVFVLGKIKFKLRASTETPKEMCIRSRKVTEEILAASEQFVRDLIVFIELTSGQPSHALVCAWHVTHSRRCVDPGEEGVNSRSAP